MWSGPSASGLRRGEPVLVPDPEYPNLKTADTPLLRRITTDENGIAETSWLVWGEYQVTESKVPEGYIDSGFTTTVKIN